MTEQEQVDLDNLKRVLIEEKIRAFDTMRNYVRYGIDNTGHKSVGDALIYVFNNADKRIKTLTYLYIKKYPDEK